MGHLQRKTAGAGWGHARRKAVCTACGRTRGLGLQRMLEADDLILMLHMKLQDLVFAWMGFGLNLVQSVPRFLPFRMGIFTLYHHLVEVYNLGFFALFFVCLFFKNNSL